MNPEGGNKIRSGERAEKREILPEFTHQDSQMGYHQPLQLGWTCVRGQDQQAPVGRKPGYHRQQLNIKAVKEVGNKRAALKEMGHILASPAVRQAPSAAAPMEANWSMRGRML
jgi:hypothetical protein